MSVYAIGRPYHPGRTHWPENLEYNYRGGEHEIRIFMPGLAPFDIVQTQRGQIELALLDEEPVILMLIRIYGFLDWSEMPFNWHAVPADEQSMPPVPGANEHAGVHLILTEAITGIIKAMRFFTLSPEFTMRLHTAIASQVVWGSDEAAFNEKLADLREQTPAKLTTRAIVRCMGGD